MRGRANGRLSLAKGEGEGEESHGAVGACGCYNPSPQSSPLIQGERRGVAGGVGSHAVPTELGLILAQILQTCRV
jgi:hypothetical protein